MFRMSRRVSRPIFLGALSGFLLLGAGIVLAQNADKNSAGPTKNDFRLRVVEPIEGATVTGDSVRVTVANAISQPLQGGSRTSDMPNPSFRIYLGNTLKGELKRDQNVLTIENVSPGSQKLVVEALNPSGEIIDRKEVNFQTVASSSPAALSAMPTTEQKPAAASAEKRVTNPQPVTELAPAPAAAPTTLLAAKTLPKTASSAPRAGLAGLALVLVGLLVSRKAKR